VVRCGGERRRRGGSGALLGEHVRGGHSGEGAGAAEDFTKRHATTVYIWGTEQGVATKRKEIGLPAEESWEISRLTVDH
jgi:hypothetical protein